MDATSRTPGAMRSARAESAFVAALALLAFGRVWAFASAFPFFHNVDEHRHADRVLKYARGYWPEPTLQSVEPELAEWVVRWGSPEYTRRREEFPEGVPAPKAPEEMDLLLRAVYEAKLAALRRYQNVDAQQPPLYPLIASAWYRLGRSIGLENVHALYFVRWLNGGVLAALVLVTWAFLREAYPRDAQIRIGVPLWIAAYPHDLLYGITDDALMPLLGGVALLAALYAGARRPTQTAFASFAGVALALAVLDKSTALFSLPAFAALALATAWRGLRDGAVGAELKAWSAFAIAFAAPVSLWFAHNLALHGDWTGIGQKYAALGIERMPVSHWLRHPLLHPSGWPEFAWAMTRSFWVGEISWHKEPLRAPGIDVLHVSTSGIALALAALAALRAGRDPVARRFEAASLLAVAVALAALVLASITHHYTGSASSMRRWVASSRFAAWAVVPFAICYVRGLQVASRAAPPRWRGVAFWCVLSAIVLATTAAEVAVTAPVFASRWNWYHLPR